MNTDLWDFKTMLQRARIPFEVQLAGAVTLVTFPLQPQAHGATPIDGAAYFNLQSKLVGIHYGPVPR